MMTPSTDDAGLFVERLAAWGERPAVVTDAGDRLTYVALNAAVRAAAETLDGAPGMVAVEAGNDLGALVAYLAALLSRCPVLLLAPGAAASDDRILKAFPPRHAWRDGVWVSGPATNALPPHPDLCLLLSTSGTTGSPKLVRLSRRNIESNAQAICEYLELGPDERAITALPFHYSFGMSIVNSHLAAGATLLLTAASVTRDAFWRFFETERATSLAGVPHTFELLDQIGFRARSFPHLRYLTQAGGRMPVDSVRVYADWARERGLRFYVMYGQTEASPRIAYVPPDRLREHPDCIGVPVPGGRIRLLDDEGRDVNAPDSQGELVYEGPNVMMGYALVPDDLARGRDVHALRTGDVAQRTPDGLYRIVGRKSRFAKLYGLRIAYDDLETSLHAAGWRALVTGDDRVLAIGVEAGVPAEEVQRWASVRLGLPAAVVRVVGFDTLPVLPSGKFDYRRVIEEAVRGGGPSFATVADAYRELLGIDDVRPGDSFLSLGGDSLHFVAMSRALERMLGELPEAWESLPVAALQALGERPVEADEPRGGHSGRKLGVAMVAACLLLVAGEAALQLRSHLKTGRSVLNQLAGVETVVVDPVTGLRTYRPGLQIEPSASSGVAMRINSLGLRSDELPPGPPVGNEVRIAVVGASTVAGAYSATNETTFPGHMQRSLRKRLEPRPVNVVNAGVEGMTVDEIERMTALRLAPLKPQVLVVYPGFNDMGAICRQSAGGAERQSLPAPATPRWVMSGDMISKNTTWLRSVPTPRRRTPTPDYDAYGARLDRIVEQARSAGMLPVLVTVARAFDRMPREQQARLAASALFFNPCLDLDGLIAAGAAINEQIRAVAHRAGVPLIDLGAAMPGGDAYFVDAGQFNAAGDRTASDLLVDGLLAEPVVRSAIGIGH